MSNLIKNHIFKIDNSKLSAIDNPFGTSFNKPMMSFTDGGVNYQNIPLNFNAVTNQLFIDKGLFKNKAVYDIKLDDGLTTVNVKFDVLDVTAVDSGCTNTCNSCNLCENKCTCNKEEKDCDYEIAIINSQISTLLCKYNDVIKNYNSINTSVSGITQIKHEIGTLTNSLSAVTTRVSTLEGGESIQNSKIDTLTTNLTELKTKVTTLESDVASHLVKINSNKQEINTLNTNVSSNTTSIQALSNKQTNDKNDLEHKITTNANTINSNKSELDGKINLNITNIETNKQGVEDNKKRIVILDTKIDNVKTTLTDSINDTNSTVSKLSSKINDMTLNDSQIEIFENQIKNLKKTVEDLKEDEECLISDLKSQFTKSTIKVNDFESNLESLGGKVKGNTNSINSLKDFKNDTNIKLNSLKTKVDSLDYSQVISELQQGVSKNEECCKLGQEELKTLKDRVCTLESQNKELNKTINSWQPIMTKLLAGGFNTLSQDQVNLHISHIKAGN